QQCYELPGKFENTTLAPSGKAMAYSDAAGVHVAAIPDGCAAGDAGALVFPGAKHPDWGPADVPVIADKAPVTTTPGQPTGRGGAPAAKLSLRVTRRGKVTVKVPSAGRLTVTAKRGKRTVAAKRKTVKVASTVTLTLKARGKVTVSASFAPVGGTKQTV